MKVFSFLKKDKPSAEAEAHETRAIGKRFILHTTPIGWQSGMQQPDGSLEVLQSEKDVPVEGDGWKRTEAIVKSAVAANAKHIKQAKTISLLLDDFSVQMTDNKQAVLVAASGATARQFGKQWLNVKDVSYGYADLPLLTGSVEKKQKDGVYAFIDAQRMRDYLALFDKDGIKVAEAIPKEYLMVRHGIQSGEPVYAGFQMSGHTSTLVLINHVLGIVQVRKIPVGFLTLVKAVSVKLGVSVQDAIQTMAQKDLVTEVLPISPDDVESVVLVQGRSLHFQALQPPLTRLLDNIKEFLAFFAFQKVAGAPKQLELFGSVVRVAGLAEWLGQYSGMPVAICKQSMLELFVKLEQPVACNLLKGAESSLLTVGRTRFFFTEDKGFVSGQELAMRHTQGTVTQSEPQRSSVTTPTGTRNRPARPVGRSSGRRADREKTDGGGGGLVALFSRLNIGKQTESVEEASLDAEQTNDRQFAALFVLFIVGLLYWGYSQYEKVSKTHTAQVNVYLSVATENQTLQQQVRNQEVTTRKLGAAVDITKIFWSEKFLALANNMTKHIWLTDVYLAEDERSVAGAKMKSKTMVIEGHVLPSTDGHVQIIAEYIDRLLRDNKGFMSDFRDVVFEGAEIEGDPASATGDPQIHFTLRALYDKNKRVESKKGGSDDSPAGLDAMQQNIDQHNQQLEDLLSGNKDK